MTTLLELPAISPPEFTAQVSQGGTITVWGSAPSVSPKVTIYLENSQLIEGGEVIRQPIPVTIVAGDEGCFQANNDTLGVYGAGVSPSEAIDDFINVLSDTWDGLKDIADQDLTQDAIELRNRLAQHFGGTLDAEGGCSL